ncbi:hypothetical protein OS189_08735 [Sulfitobacter sp. F26169L]|uniref:hypothetical protein n=1 Tax=Sulfitobacter sp. F26169L TaxID=2996015 RepID=UPI002260BEB6|nr:hypothetical protein [Sulfitobacter sp. F26169L]MCX7566426.1 hypothetical protein [Sulfitobacter sp. F26169L]
MRGFIAGLSFMALMAGPVAAQGFKAENGVIVLPVAGGFSVTGDAGLGARGMWCAAADYARKREGARASQRLYIAQGRTAGLGQRDPVTFTLSAQGLTPVGVIVLGSSLARAGANLSVGHAYGFCADSKLVRDGHRP